MGLSLDTDMVAAERIHVAKQRIDFRLPGAMDEYNLLISKGSGTAAEYEALAEKYPIKFERGFIAASAGKHAAAIAALLKKNDKAALSIQCGSDIGYEDPPRISTGSLVLDFILNGGLPRGYVGQFKGPEGLGKTFACLKAAAEVLRMGGRVMWLAAERFDKSWARKCGVPVPFSQKEIVEASDDAQRQAMVTYNTLNPLGENFNLVVGREGNRVLQTAVDCIELNVWDLIVLDSIAVLKRNTVLDKKNVGDETMGGEAKMINDFCGRAESAFNTVESWRGRVRAEVHLCTVCGETCDKKTDHKKCADGSKPKFETTKDIGEPVRSACVVINQIRERGIGSPVPQKPDAGGGRGLRHTKGYDIEFQKGEPLSTTWQNRPVAYAKRVVMEATKSKIGPPHRTGVIEMWFQSVPGVSQAGEYNFLVDLLGCKWKNDDKIAGLGELSGIVRYDQPWYIVGSMRLKGLPAFMEYLSNPANAHVVAAIKAGIQDWIRQGGL